MYVCLHFSLLYIFLMKYVSNALCLPTLFAGIFQLFLFSVLFLFALKNFHLNYHAPCASLIFPSTNPVFYGDNMHKFPFLIKSLSFLVTHLLSHNTTKRATQLTSSPYFFALFSTSYYSARVNLTTKQGCSFL